MGPCTFRGWMERKSHVKSVIFTHTRLELRLARSVWAKVKELGITCAQ